MDVSDHRLGDRVFAAVVLGWRATGVPSGAPAAPFRRRVTALCAAGLDVAVLAGEPPEAVDALLRARPAGPGRLWLCAGPEAEPYEVGEAGLRPVPSWEGDGARGLRTALALLAERGIGPGAVLVIGDRFAAPGRSDADAIASVPEAARATLVAVGPGLRPAAGPDTGDPAEGVLFRESGPGEGVLFSEGGPAEDVPLQEGGPDAGVLFLEGGPDAVLGVLDRQVRLRRRRRVPLVDDDPAWTIRETGRDPARNRVTETLLTLGAGGFATRGSVEEAVPGSHPLVLAMGIYTGVGSGQHLLAGPRWTGLVLRPPPEEDLRLLDLRSGLMAREETGRTPPVRTLRLACVNRPGVVAMRAEAGIGRLRPGPPLRLPAEGQGTEGRHGGRDWARVTGAVGWAAGDTGFDTAGSGLDVWDTGGGGGAGSTGGSVGGTGPGGVAALSSQRVGRDGGVRTVERIAAYTADPVRRPVPHDAAGALEAAERLGFDRLLVEQREAWAGRWAAVNVSIPDDPAAQLAVRFALFQLWTNADRLAGGGLANGSEHGGRAWPGGGAEPGYGGRAGPPPAVGGGYGEAAAGAGGPGAAGIDDEYGEAAVSARGLSGGAYGGHVFWDADVFVLPALVSMHPAAARAMVAYRLGRLGPARARAATLGCAGARFPWESAATGDDVTPAIGHLGGEAIGILTGRMEEHITADVAWAAAHYARWSGEDGFLTGPARPLLTETARYWTSRCRTDRDGRAHIDRVIGPDEYHEGVTDNAFTNVMARWNLRRAARLAGPGCAEAGRWLTLAGRLVDGHDPVTGLYEQFTGYFRLEPLTMAEVATPPVAADLLLGRERVAATQIIKQPDVLMLHHMVPEEVEAGSLPANLDFYGPRTAHGSSLSPAIMASLLARAGRADEALALLRTALVLDLDDLTGTTADGLHLATLGGVWQAMLTGFAGARVSGGVLRLDPVLPAAWGGLGLRFRCLGRRVRLDVTRETVTVRTDGPLRVRLGDGDPRPVDGSACLRGDDR
ncbi:glycosyl hydrolase family 65 protein [Streptosporangium sp. NPDC048047]|uniref:glycosyl hydrolase family 65 protein n=1 Tax=Streptosporangium sp. NPDC048047 TaxID=3155748 RepID=UPI003434AC16